MSSLRTSLLLASILAVSTGCASNQQQAACPSLPATADVPAVAGGPEDDLDRLTKEQLAAKMIEVSMGKELAKEVKDAMAVSLGKLPGLPPGFMERFNANADVNELPKMIIPIYVKLYERETMIAAIRFYQSDQGQKLIAKMPEATRLSMQAGQQWGKELVEKTLSELKSGK